ncbi:MAG: hypothetical protein KC451_03555 [Amylibacter sp.]|jgi:apolipoprotein D and lipocalin family protein|nr:hypothetical protein [Amylibacter sp.]
MRIIAALLVLGMLTGCFPQSSKPRADVSLLRNPTVTMSATSRFDAGRFSGKWLRRAGFDDDWDLQAFEFVAPRAGGDGAWRETVLNDGTRVQNLANVRLDIPGVFFLDYVGQRRMSRQVVVLWVDEGFRTAAISTRDGRSAVIVDRKASGGEDRIVAAKSVLEQNGFDLSKLQ